LIIKQSPNNSLQVDAPKEFPVREEVDQPNLRDLIDR
jgi:hypothetical protein